MPRDKGRKVDVYFDFSVAFDVVFYQPLKSNLERYVQTKRHLKNCLDCFNQRAAFSGSNSTTSRR